MPPRQRRRPSKPRCSRRSAGHPAESFLASERCRDRHPGVLERPGRIQALVLGIEVRHSGDAGRAGHFIKWGVAFAQGDGLMAAGERGEDFAETPHAALVDRHAGTAALAPEGFEFGGVQASGARAAGFPSGMRRFRAGRRSSGSAGSGWRSCAPCRIRCSAVAIRSARVRALESSLGSSSRSRAASHRRFRITEGQSRGAGGRMLVRIANRPQERTVGGARSPPTAPTGAGVTA